MLRWLHLRPNALAKSQEPAQASRWPLIAGAVIGIFLGMMLYVNTLSLPFFEDDATHIRYLATVKSPFEPFLTAKGLAAYRPLGEMFLKLWYLLLGRHDAVWLRYINISLHSLDVALVAAIGWRLYGGRNRYAAGGLAAVLFAVLPFAYQAIPWINVFFYPLNNLLQLLMILFYWQAREKGSKGLLTLAVFLGAISPFGIEYGVVNGGLVLGVELVLWLQKRQRGIWLGGPLLVLFFNIVYLLIWLAVPKTAYEFGPPTLERMMQISFYLLQGLTYPTAPLAYPLVTHGGMNDLAAVALIGVPTLLLVVGLLFYRRKWPVLLFGLIWYAALNLPALLTLTFDYVFNSPRILYPPGPALAWLWSAFFVALAELGRKKRVRAALATVAAVSIIIVVSLNVNFVRARTTLYHVVEDTVHDLARIARQVGPETQLLAVNMPSWATLPNQFYALGNYGIQFIPFYVGLGDFIYSENDAEQPTLAVQFHNIRQSMPYFYGMYGPQAGWDELREYLTTADDVYVAQYTPEHVSLAQAGYLAEQPAISDLLAIFDGHLALTLNDATLSGSAVALGLEWQLNQAVTEDLTVFVHLIGPDGQLVDQADGYPLLGLSPFWLWDAGRSLYDRRELSLPKDAPHGRYHVAVGVYDPATGARLPAVDQNGNPWPDDAAIVFELDGPQN